MEKEQFLKGLKKRELCETYAVKFANTYSGYLENEEKSRMDLICRRMISEEEFEEWYGEKWRMRWFYIGDNILYFYNEMGWDFRQLSSSKDLLYSSEHEVNYKDYVMQDIWERLLEEDCENLCWGVLNFISVLKDTEEQRALKGELQALMSEIYQYAAGGEEQNAGALAKYIKENRGIESTFGHIQIDIKTDCLGQGGNGVVYAGRLAETDVAVKFLINYTRKKLERFKAEYINISVVKENLCNAVNYLHYDTLELGTFQIPYIIMKKYRMSLKEQRARMNGKVTWEDLLKVFYGLCESIKSLEKNNIIHRDLKPENILVDGQGRYVVTDFGIAHFESESYPIKGLTKRNDRMANWEFSAPEQITGGEITFATDIYAFGQILYWFCFGSINRGTGGRQVRELFSEEKAGLLDRIIHKAIANEPEARYQTIEEIEKAFAKIRRARPNVYADMYLFSEAVRSVFPEAYKTPFRTDNAAYIRRMIDKINETDFKRELWWSTGLANEEFRRIKCLDNGNYLLCGREIIIDEMWAFVADFCYNDLLILKVGNPDYYRIDGKEYNAIAVINHEIIEPIEKTASGFYRFSDGHVEPVRELEIEERHNYREIDEDRYLVIGVQHHCSILPENDENIRRLQEERELTAERLRLLQRQISRHKTYEVELGL